jgi:hypothetical protein
MQDGTEHEQEAEYPFWLACSRHKCRPPLSPSLPPAFPFLPCLVCPRLTHLPCDCIPHSPVKMSSSANATAADRRAPSAAADSSAAPAATTKDNRAREDPSPNLDEPIRAAKRQRSTAIAVAQASAVIWTGSLCQRCRSFARSGCIRHACEARTTSFGRAALQTVRQVQLSVGRCMGKTDEHCRRALAPA